MAKQTLYKTAPLCLGVLAVSFLLGYIVLAWTEPSVAPPGGNVDAPINVGTDYQVKDGDLGLRTFYIDDIKIGGTIPDLYSAHGNLIVKNSSNKVTLEIDGSAGNITMSGDLEVSKGIILGGEKRTTWPGGESDILDILYFGSGKDGDIVITSNTTLSRDMEYRNLTINSGALNPNGWRIFVSNTLTIASGGKISRNGTSNGSALAAHTIGGSGAGAPGVRSPYPRHPLVKGAKGEDSEAGGNGGAGGSCGAGGGAGGKGGNWVINGIPGIAPIIIPRSGGAGGGSGDADGYGGCAASSRVGASGGGVLVIFAKNIVMNGDITAKGGNGVNAYGCGCGGPTRGGSGGGGGGHIFLAYKTKTGSGIIDVSGGNGGNGCVGCGNGQNGSPGYSRGYQVTY